MRISKKKEAGMVATVPMNSGKNSISGDAEVGSPANGSAALPEDNTTALVILPAIQSIVAADFFKPVAPRFTLKSRMRCSFALAMRYPAQRFGRLSTTA